MRWVVFIQTANEFREFDMKLVHSVLGQNPILDDGESYCDDKGTQGFLDQFLTIRTLKQL